MPVMKNSKPELLILAAGVGSRYGGLKQLDGIGPNGETIMDYSIFDAIRSGFGRVVFVIKEAHHELFESKIVPKFKSRIDVGYAFQGIESLPDGFSVPEGRTKPWGTGHAILCAAEVISRPFAVINADDFYGCGAFQTMAETLQGLDPGSEEFFLMGYRLSNTLSRHGSVSRGVCDSRNGYLTTINELTRISISGERITSQAETGDEQLKPDSIVSMNFWGFSPGIFPYIKKGFDDFLMRDINSLDAEYFITQPVDNAVKSGVRVRLLTTGEKWLGITYPEDKASVVSGIQDRIDAGIYPPDLTAD